MATADDTAAAASAVYPLPDRDALLTGARTTVGRVVAAALAVAGAAVREVDPGSATGLADAVGHCRTGGAGPHLLVHVVELPVDHAGQSAVDAAPGVDAAAVADADAAFDRTLAVARRIGRQAGPALTDGGVLVFVALAPVGHRADAVVEAGLTALVRALATELGPAGVRVNQVAGPGCVARPDQAAAAVLFLAGAGAAGVTGQTLLLGGTP